MQDQKTDYSLRRTLACGCVLGYERCFDCRYGLHPDQETALAISIARATNSSSTQSPQEKA